MSKIKKKYAPNRTEIVAVTKLLCSKLPEYISQLEATYGSVNYPGEEFITRLFNDANALEALPPPVTRRSDRMQTRFEMDKLVPSILADALLLEQYINAAYPPDEVGLYTDATTIPTYRKKVNNRHWSSVINMLVGMKAFVAANRAQLTAAGMPENYETELDDRYNTFTGLKSQLSVTNSNSISQTGGVDDDKSDLYKKVLAILKNLRAIYYTDPDKRGEFSYAYLRSQAILGGPAGGIRGQLMDSVNSLPIQEAILESIFHAKITQSNTSGRFEFKQLTEGIYSINIMAEGYEPLLLENIVVKKGVVTTLKAILMVSTMPVMDKTADMQQLSEDIDSISEAA